MTLNGIIYDLKIDIDGYKRSRIGAVRRCEALNIQLIDAKLEELEHYLKLLEKVERDGET